MATVTSFCDVKRTGKLGQEQTCTEQYPICTDHMNDSLQFFIDSRDPKQLDARVLREASALKGNDDASFKALCATAEEASKVAKDLRIGSSSKLATTAKVAVPVTGIAASIVGCFYGIPAFAAPAAAKATTLFNTVTNSTMLASLLPSLPANTTFAAHAASFVPAAVTTASYGTMIAVGLGVPVVGLAAYFGGNAVYNYMTAPAVVKEKIQ